MLLLHGFNLLPKLRFGSRSIGVKINMEKSVFLYGKLTMSTSKLLQCPADVINGLESLCHYC